MGLRQRKRSWVHKEKKTVKEEKKGYQKKRGQESKEVRDK
jgi:hypothetical protein